VGVTYVGLAPVVHTIWVSEILVMLQLTLSIKTWTTDASVPNLEPVIVTSVPPTVVPLSGEILEMLGVKVSVKSTEFWISMV